MVPIQIGLTSKNKPPSCRVGLVVDRQDGPRYKSGRPPKNKPPLVGGAPCWSSGWSRLNRDELPKTNPSVLWGSLLFVRMVPVKSGRTLKTNPLVGGRARCWMVPVQIRTNSPKNKPLLSEGSLSGMVPTQIRTTSPNKLPSFYKELSLFQDLQITNQDDLPKTAPLFRRLVARIVRMVRANRDDTPPKKQTSCQNHCCLSG